jgi:diaminohydroxyphosphoribosylaminopyrimidine deaminase/5-amino-6-(5-phosphoribosylamino)uracil reductase
MRHAADAVLTGMGTVLADDPLLTDRSGAGTTADRCCVWCWIRGCGFRWIRSWCSQRATMFSGVCTEAEEERVDVLEAAGSEVKRVAGHRGRLDLGAVLDVLGSGKIPSVLLECGSELNGAFLTEGW